MTLKQIKEILEAELLSGYESSGRLYNRDLPGCLQVEGQ